jgi:hypothetical protein
MPIGDFLRILIGIKENQIIERLILQFAENTLETFAQDRESQMRAGLVETLQIIFASQTRRFNILIFVFDIAVAALAIRMVFISAL